MDLSRYPSPIAISYAEMLAIENKQLRFRAVIRVFADTLRYVTLIAVSDYVTLRAAGAFKSERLDKSLLEKLKRPSLGHWNHLLRETLACMNECRQLLFVPELWDFYFHDSPRGVLRERPLVSTINELIHLRNVYVHPDIYPADDVLGEVASQAERSLDLLLEALAFLCEYPLVRVWHESGATEECCGDIRRAPPEKPQAASILLRPRDLTRRPNPLDLGCFVYYGSHPRDHRRQLLLYETMMNRRITYLLANDLVLLEERGTRDDPVQEFRELLASLGTGLARDLETQRLALAGAADGALAPVVNWRSVQARCTSHSRSLFQRYILEEKFAGLDDSVARGAADAEIARFLGSRSRLLMVVAESGLGKTNLLCRWMHELSHGGHAVLFVSGRAYDGSSFPAWLLSTLQRDPLFADRFKGTFAELLTLLSDAKETREGGRRLVILVDAINEAPEPQQLFEEVVRFCETAEEPWVKVMASIRTFVWENLRPRCSMDPEVFFHSSVDGRPAPFVALAPFSVDESRNAFEIYRRKYDLKSTLEELPENSRRFLANPLMLRFAAEAYHGHALPPRIVSHSVFERYAKERIRKVDLYFLDYLTEAFWRLGRDVLRLEQVRRELSGAEGPLSKPSAVHPGGGPLVGKLRDYLLSDPVYESSRVLVCETPGCKRYERELPPAIPDCPTCGASGAPRERDVRTSYVCLRSENVIQEYEDGMDVAVRFTYDRWFEFLVGRMLAKTIVGEISPGDAGPFVSALRLVANRHEFWGAFRNVLLEELGKPKLSPEDWRTFVASAEREPDRAVIVALRQIAVSALKEFCTQDVDRARALLLALTDPRCSTVGGMKIALETVHELVLEGAQLTPSSVEAEVLRRGLRDERAGLRDDSARLAFGLAEANLDPVLGLLEELQRDITGTALVTLVSSRRRAALLARFDSLASLTLYLVGSRFSDTTVRQRVFGMGRNVLAPLSGRLMTAARRPIAALLARKIRSMYWEKGPLPCNALDIALSLRSDLSGARERIAELFDGMTLDGNEVAELSRIQNGFLAWCLYSIIPSAVQESGDTATALRRLRAMYEQGNHATRYIVSMSLWVLASFSEVDPEATDAVYREIVEDYIDRDGGWVTFVNESPGVTKEPVVRAYLDERTPGGSRRRYWARERKDMLELRYDNSALLQYAEYLARRSNPSSFHFILSRLRDGGWSHEPGFLVYVIDALGNLGERYPGPALRTLASILEGCVVPQVEVEYDGVRVTQGDVVVHALKRIKGYHPTLVDHVLAALPPIHRETVRAVEHVAAFEASDRMESYYGELIYQRCFLTYADVRRAFGRAILTGGASGHLDGFFLGSVQEMLGWLASLTERNAPPSRRST